MNRIDPALLALVQEGFYARGETVATWARRGGFEPGMVYQVLSGRCQCRRGVSHRIAVALGLKPKTAQPSTTERLLTSEEHAM